MAKDQDLYPLGPWPLGMNNRATDTGLSQGAARNAINVDIDSTGAPRMRAGRTNRNSGRWHSLFRTSAIRVGVKNGSMVSIVRSGAGVITTTVLRTDMADGYPVSWLELGGVIYYSNGLVNGRIVGGVNKPWGLPIPPVVASTVNDRGALTAGIYQVTSTYLDSAGEESGAGSATSVVLAAGGGITVTIPTPIETAVTHVNLYMTPVNGEVFYLVVTVPVATSSVILGASSTPGRELETQFMYPPPPAQNLFVHGGRIWMVQGNKLLFTDTHRPGLIGRKAFNFAANIDLAVSVDAGIFVCHAITEFLSGRDPDTMDLRQVKPYGALPNSAIRPLRDNVVMWVPRKGLLMVAGQDGSVQNVNEEAIATREDANRAAMAYVERNGMRHLIASIRGGATSNLQCTDYATMEIVRKS